MSTYTPNLNLLEKNPQTEGSDVFNIQTMLNDNWDKLDSFFALLEASIAPLYSTSSAYAVGTWCTHDGKLYQCTTAIGSGGEAWNASHWTAKSTTELIAAVRNAIPTVPSASSTTPKMDGTAAVGTGTTWARADHVHPTDTSRAASSHNHAASAINSGTLGVARGGTGKSSVTANRFLVGNGTSAMVEKTAAQVLALLGAAQVEVGSYVGTGTNGSSNPNSLTFPFAPKLFWIYATQDKNSASVPNEVVPTDRYYNFETLVPFANLTTSYVKGKGPAALTSSSSSVPYAKKSSDGKTITWYNTYTSGVSGAQAQLNTSNLTYHYIALG